MEREWQFFFASVFCGVMLLGIYDLIRAMRNTWKHKSWIIAVQDILFWLAAGILLFSCAYRWNNGIIRWYFLVGICLGMLCYRVGISQFFLEFVSFLLKRLKMFFSWVNIILERFLKTFNKILGMKNGENVKTEKETDTQP